MTPVELVLSRLKGVKETESGYMAFCSAHDDSTQSLSVNEGREGRVLVYCHAGCALQDVIEAAGLDLADLFEQSGSPSGKRCEAIYDYEDEQGELLFQKLRLEGKSFLQRRPDPSAGDGWAWKLGGVRRVLYNLPKVLEAVEAGQRIYLVEGEKDADSVVRLGLVATTNPEGAGKWREEYTRTLAGAHVVILPDGDDKGRQHADKVDAALDDVAASVRMLELPGTGKDVTEWIESRRGTDLETLRAELEAMAETALPAKQKSEPVQSAATRKERGPSQATVLVQLARESYELGISTEGEPYAVPSAGPRIARLLRGSRAGLRAELASAYFEVEQKAASSSALADALATIEGFAARCEPVELHLRTAQTDDTVWLDLGRKDGRCARIDAERWQLTDKPEVLFRRSSVTAPTPNPTQMGDLTALRELLGMGSDSPVWPLMVGWMVGAMFPGIPRPVLLLTGEQGTSKSTMTRMLAGVIDPALPQTRCAPRDERDWIAATSASTVVALDNVSSVPDWLSDAICRAVTGEGYVRRRLFTDGDVAVTTFRRSIIANGIDLAAYRGDLLDRSILVVLPRIEAGRRRTEEDLDCELERLRPTILAGLLDLVAKVLRELPTVQVEQPPRMADYARVLAALDQATGWGTLDAYRTLGREALSGAVDGDHLARAVAALLDAEGSWIGSASDLLEELDRRRADSRAPRGWPTTPQGLAGKLRRAAPALRAAEYEIDSKKSHSSSRKWTMSRPSRHCDGTEEVGKSSSRPSPSSADALSGAIARDGADGRDDEIPTLSGEWGEA